MPFFTCLGEWLHVSGKEVARLKAMKSLPQNCMSLPLTFQTRRHCKNVKAPFQTLRPSKTFVRCARQRWQSEPWWDTVLNWVGIRVASLWEYNKLLQLAWWGHGHQGFLPVLLCFHQGQGLLDGDFEDGWVLALHCPLSKPEISTRCGLQSSIQIAHPACSV